MSNFNAAISAVLNHEGGFADDRNDPGGATHFGISLRYLKTLGELGDLDDDGDIDYFDIKNMTLAEAVDIYQQEWWDKYHYSLINSQAIANKIFDMAVNMGQFQAVKLAQRACNTLGADLVCDGALGLQTFKAINNASPALLLMHIRNECANFYLTLIAQKPILEKYKNGWLTRAYS